MRWLLGGGITARADDGDKLTTTAAAAGKSFTIKTARGYWYAYGKGHNSNVIAGSKGDLASVNGDLDFKNETTISKFTLVEQTKSDKTKRYYLYSIDTKKWVVTNGSYLGLADKPYEGDYVSFATSTGTTKDTYPTCIYFGDNQQNMYGISSAYTPDVYKFFGLYDEGNMSVVSESGTFDAETYQKLQSSLNDNTGFYGAKTISASPIADISDFNGQAGKAYLIHNVSGGRNGYLHVDADGNLTYEGIPGDHADLTNFIFTTEMSGDNIYLKNGDKRYIPTRTNSSQNFTTIADKIAGAGIATVVAKSGYKPSTLDFQIDGHYMNVNDNGVVTTWDNSGGADPNGVWEFTPVDINSDFITTTIKRHITSQNGVKLDDGTVQISSDNPNNTTKKYRDGQHIYIPTTVGFFSGGVGVVGTTTNISVKATLPFEVSSDKNWHWYHLSIRGNKWLSANKTNNQVTISNTFTDDDYSLWAFKGSYNQGIQLYNKGLGTTYTLKDTTTPEFTQASGSNNFIIDQNSDGFTLRTGRSGNNCFNDVGNNNTFGYWNHSNALTDEGSTFRVFLPKGFYTLKNYMNASQGDTSYGYLGLSGSGDASTKNNIMGNEATASLNDVVYIAPTTAPKSSDVTPSYVSMQLQGKSIQGLSQSAQVTIGDNNVSFLVKRPYVGYFAFGSAVSNATPDEKSYLHTANTLGHKVVGWSTDAPATSWQVSPAGPITMPATEVDGKFYATFYAPFAVKLTGATAYTLTLNADKKSATLNAVTLKDGNILPKESAVLIIANGTSYTVEPVIDNTTEKVPSILNGVSLAESWSDHGNDLILGQVDNKIGFYKWGTGNTLKNNRCYLPASALNGSSAKGVVINFGTATGINAATLQPDKADGKIYNLQGQEVNRSYKGIVIKNGSKVIQ